LEILQLSVAKSKFSAFLISQPTTTLITVIIIKQQQCINQRFKNSAQGSKAEGLKIETKG